ncbi:MAG: hypothetical protein B7Y41_10390 [Hydrogenophilales bacterium 28-61-23]|nr:MAG: hypothetical protein B7Y41_10390 [Hydrogenophilales bacterium 28-61-23]
MTLAPLIKNFVEAKRTMETINQSEKEPKSVEYQQGHGREMGSRDRLGPVPKYIKAMVVVTAVIILLASWLMSISQSAQETAKSEYIYQRQELHYALLGRPRDEVIEIIGRPENSTPQSQPGDEYWYYRNPPTWDEAADKRDSSMILYFEGGRVSRLSF